MTIWTYTRPKPPSAPTVPRYPLRLSLSLPVKEMAARGEGMRLLTLFFASRWNDHGFGGGGLSGAQRLGFILHNLATPWVPLEDIRWRQVLMTFLLALDPDEDPLCPLLEDNMRVFLGIAWDKAEEQATEGQTWPRSPLKTDGRGFFGGMPLTVPAFFWSDGAEFLEAALNMARILREFSLLVPKLPERDIEGWQRAICHETQVLRTKLAGLQAFVGWLPLDFGPHWQPADMSQAEASSPASSSPPVNSPSSALGMPTTLPMRPRVVLTAADAVWDGTSDSQVFTNSAVKRRSNPFPHTASLHWWRAYLPERPEGQPRWYYSTMSYLGDVLARTLQHPVFVPVSTTENQLMEFYDEMSSLHLISKLKKYATAQATGEDEEETMAEQEAGIPPW